MENSQSHRVRAAIRELFPDHGPADRCVLRLMPEWGVEFPLWTSGGVVGPLESGELPLSDGLVRELSVWGQEWNDWMEPVLDGAPEPDLADWEERGVVLRNRLVRELEGHAEVNLVL